MRNFKEILRYKIELILNKCQSKNIPLTSDYLAEKLLATLNKTNGKRKQLERDIVAVIMQDIADNSEIKQIKEVADFVEEMLLDPISQLTPEEMRRAYNIQQHIYDKSDIENELDIATDDYIEKFNIDKDPVTEKEIEDMSIELRKILDNNADACWSAARAEAVTKILENRNFKGD